MDAFALQSLLAICNAWQHLRAQPCGPEDLHSPLACHMSVAWQLMAQYNWHPGLGLGARNQGIVNALQVQQPAGRQPYGVRPGLGTGLHVTYALHVTPAQPTAVEQSPAAVSMPTTMAFAEMVRLLIASDASDAVAMGRHGPKDAWLDVDLLHYLQHKQHRAECSQAERARVRKRVQMYAMPQPGKLARIMADGSLRWVPKPEDRWQLVLHTHGQTGHYGEKRTLSLLATSYWWRGMAEAAAEVCASCRACSMARTSGRARNPELQPLPIQHMFYRWGVDLCGPFPETARGNKYIMVCIEHLSKHMEVIPLPNKRPGTTAAAFRAHVLCRFGAMAEVITDRGGEFEAEFDASLDEAFIDHRTTSADHPQADGLAERAVQTIKKGLRKLVHESKKVDCWDEQVPWVAMGYNCSVQQATGFSPYHLLYGRQPVVPPAALVRWEEPVDLDASDVASADLLRRAAEVKRVAVIAAENLQVAQHRDTRRYAAKRDGVYKRSVHRFEPGDFVYVERSNPQALQMRVKGAIYRIKQVKPSGVVVLHGKCGREMQVHLEKLLPCHLANIDPEIDVTLQRPGASLACEMCGQQDDEDVMLLCDQCGCGWHTFCLTPALPEVPPGAWVCPRCEAAGVSVDDVARRLAAAPPPEPALVEPRFPTAASRRQEERLAQQAAAAQELHGRVIQSKFVDPRTGRGRWYKGVLAFRGAEHGPWYFTVTYEDGEVKSMRLAKAISSLLPVGTELPAAPA